ncbi:hypothetical protein L596_006175 [Steinernema carpocapsae]|uniref:Uncharacterized protein n=1 Tax=Steinernema carpocapsae TaxID=34508 RepID=A0A4U8V1E1_STECR|nr:hypothetical protein L596_006175 [Steinernema carpocapsae]
MLGIGCSKCRVYYSPSNPKSEKELIYCCESDGTDKCKPFCNIKDYPYTLDDISLMESFCGIESTEADIFMCVTKSRVAGSSSCNVAFPKGTKCNTDHPFIGQKAPYANCPQNGPFQPGTFAGICKTENYERDAVYAYLRPQNSTLFVQSGEGSYSATGVAASQLLLTTRSSTANALQITLFTPGDFISVYVLQLAYNRLTFIGRLSPSFLWDSISVATDNTISVFLAKGSNLTVERFNIDF